MTTNIWSEMFYFDLLWDFFNRADHQIVDVFQSRLLFVDYWVRIEVSAEDYKICFRLLDNFNKLLDLPAGCENWQCSLVCYLLLSVFVIVVTRTSVCQENVNDMIGEGLDPNSPNTLY